MTSPARDADSLPSETSPDSAPVHVGGRATPLDFLFFARPVLLPPVWTIALLGTIIPGRWRIDGWWWLVFFVQLSCLFGAVYTLNQIRDIESDRLNRKLFFLPEGLISLRAAWRYTIALNLAALVLALWFGLASAILTAAVIALGIAYSLGRSPWKNRPLLGLLANVLGHGTLVFLLGRVFVGQSVSGSVWPSLPYFLAVGAVYLATTVPDAIGDRLSNKRTVAVCVGGRLTMAIAALFVSGSVALAVAVADRHLLVAAIIVWPFFGLGVWRPRLWAARAAQAAVLALSLAAAWAYPAYAVLLFAGFMGTRLFFRWRFGMNYPSFGTGK
ncbi:MAG TPA: UbiA family prenyltransferase [Acidobacteriota bacterium]|nr:UbiA family prenyltransferase [Acidobacteriota bacterium]